MKSILIPLLLFTLASCSNEKNEVELDAALSITKTEVGYNIYSNKGELILEFTNQNTDSSSLETLEYIYITAKEFYNRDPYEEEKKNKSVNYSRIFYE